MTNKEKYDNYLSLIKQREDDFISNSIVIPTVLYSVDNFCTIKYIVSGFRYDNKARLITPYKITRERLKLVKDYYESTPELTLNNLTFICYEVFNGNKIERKIQYKDLSNYYITFEEAKTELNKKVEEEKKLLKNGYIRCDYCSKLTKGSEIMVGNISNYKQYGVSGKNFNFCSTDCFKHKQMGSEG